jgi:hypothetical protein
MESLCHVSRGKTGEEGTGKTLGCYRQCSGKRDLL